VKHVPGITGGPAYKLFKELLDDPNSYHRSYGIQGIKRMGAHARSSAPLVLALTKDKNANIRSSALVTLKQMIPDFPGFKEAAIRALSDTESVVRHTAVRTLSEMTELPAEIAAPLGAMISDKSVSSYINSILSKMGPRAAGAVPYAAEALGNKDTKIAYHAASILSRVGPAAAPAEKELIKALEHKDRFVRRYSAQAIGNIGPDAKKAISALKPLLKDPDPYNRNVARRALIKLQTGRTPNHF